jgi:hypothetical protein
MGAGSKQFIKGRGLGYSYGIAAAAIALTNAVHDDQNNRFFHISVSFLWVCIV